MIADYTRPQLVIKQQLQKLPNGGSRVIGAFTLGPQFFLNRYTRVAERAKMVGTLFEEVDSSDESDWQVVPAENKLSNHVVDLDYTRLFAENLEGQLCVVNKPSLTLSEALSTKPLRVKLLALDQPNKLRVANQGLVVTITVGGSGGSTITGATLVAGGLGFLPNKTSGEDYIIDVEGVNSSGVALAGTGGQLHVTTNAYGQVTSIVGVETAGTGYSAGTIEITPTYACANLLDPDEENVPLYSGLRGRPVKAGDVVYVSHVDPNTTEEKSFRRTVLRVERDEVAAKLGTTVSDTYRENLFAEDETRNPSDGTAAFAQVTAPTNWSVVLNSASKAADWNGMVQGASYNGNYGDRYTITVVKSGLGGDGTNLGTARLRIRSASGGFSADNVGGVPGELVSTTNIAGDEVFKIKHAALGGLIVNLVSADENPLVAGQVFTFSIVGKYDGGAPQQVLAPGTPRLVINEDAAAYTGPRDTRYVVTVTKGVTTAFKRAAFKVTAVSSGKITAVSLLDGGYGYPASAVLADGVAPATETSGSGTGAVLSLVTDVNGVVTSGVVAAAHAAASVTADASTDAVTLNSHGLVAGQRVKFSHSSGSVPGGITAGTYYYVVAAGLTTNTFKIATAADAAALDISSAGSNVTLTTEISGGASYATNDVVYALATTAMRPSTPYAGAEIQVTDTAGIDRPQTYTVAHGTFMDLGTYGLQFKFDTLSTPDNQGSYNTGLRTGDCFYIDAVAAAATGPRGILVLSGQVADSTLWDSADLAATQFGLDFRILFTGEVPKKGNAAPELAWTATADGARVRCDLTLEVTSRDEDHTWVPVKESAFGRLFTHWRGLVPAVSGETIKFLRNEVDIKARFGLEDLDNPACMAALIAFRGSQGKGVYAARLPSNNLAGYTAVLKQAERMDGVYAVVPTTGDLAVQDGIRDHVNKCSQEEWKLWRRCYLGLNSPGAYGLLQVDSENSNLLGTITANGSGNVVVTCEGAGFMTSGVRAGDLLRTSYGTDAWGATTWSQYEVLEVNSNDELILVSGPSSAITPAIKLEVWRPDTGLSQAEFAGTRAEHFANRRVAVVWNDNPLQVTASGSLVSVPAYYLAAEVAGLRTALVQQQGLTFTELEHSLSRSPSMFTKFSQEELNLAASKGVMIVTQESEDGPVFIRHQLTTKTTEGSLYYEDSVGYNFDMIAYDVKDVLQPFMGKQNATPETVDAIETKLRTKLDYNKTNRTDSIIGPALLDYSYGGKKGAILVEIDPVFKDRINVGANLEFPLPINSIVASLFATTIQDQTVAA